MFTISYNAKIKFTSKQLWELFKSVLILWNVEWSSCGQLQKLAPLWFWHRWISVLVQAVISTTSIQCQNVLYCVSVIFLSFQLLINHLFIFLFFRCLRIHPPSVHTSTFPFLTSLSLCWLYCTALYSFKPTIPSLMFHSHYKLIFRLNI